MINSSAVLFVASRALAAAGNVLAIAIFTRLAGPQEYGQYVLIFAWSIIVYGFSAQWMRFSYFGMYQSGRVYEYAASLARLHATGLGGLSIGCAAMLLAGSVQPAFLLSIFTIVCGLTIYESAFEVARTLHKATAAALPMLLRTCLIVVLGSVFLWYGGTATGLAFAIGAGNLLAAIPCLIAASDVRFSDGSRAASIAMLRYGWPLLLSFGVLAIGQSIDRLLLAHLSGTSALGPYGVVADLLRQSFSVVGEAVILACGVVAKQHANDGNIEAANRELKKAFNACLTTAVFGALFFLVFGDFVLSILLGRQFVEPSRDLVPVLAVGFAFVTMRNFYFAQVIYFSRSSYFELMMSILFVIVSTMLAVWLIPSHGAYGAAVGLTASFFISCMAYLVVGRHYYRLPIDLEGAGTIAALGFAFVAGVWLIDLAGAHAGGGLFMKAALFAILAVLLVIRLGLFRASKGGTLTDGGPAIAVS